MIKFVGTAQSDKKTLLYFSLAKGRTNSFKALASKNGFEFGDTTKNVVFQDASAGKEKRYDFRSFRVSKTDQGYFLTYKPSSAFGPHLYGAKSQDLVKFEKTGRIDDITETGTLIPDYKQDGRYMLYYGERNIKLGNSEDLLKWNEGLTVLEPREGFFDSYNFEAGNAFSVDDKILLIYYVKKKADNSTRYFVTTTEQGQSRFYVQEKDSKITYSVGAAIFDPEDPGKLLWRADDAIWETPGELMNERVMPLGSVILGDDLILYFLVNETNVYSVSCPVPGRHTRVKQFSTMFKKSDKNPIIAPRPEKPWESRATFNSAAVYENGKVHFVYRALGDTDLSVLGYATSSDGINIDSRSDEPIYFPREAFETPGQHVFKTFADHFASGGGYGGIEDPRITKVDNRFFMTYVAFDGANPPRVALTSIDVDDFLNQRWDRWEKPKLISAPGMVNKNAVIFPEKIKGKYVVFHRVFPNILIDYVDNLNFDSYLQGHHFISPRKTHWDSKKIGAGAPPIKTADGWLFIYQSVGNQESHRYKMGAMLLAHDDPGKVLFRTTSPIVEPAESYENEGFKSGVVYPCGAVVMDNKLHVYYGGADTVVCAATTELDRFLYEMKHDREPKLERINIPLN